MTTLLIFIIILGLLVVVHEFGHFITARMSGMKVFEFGFGFPPRAFGFYKDQKSGKWVFVKGSGKDKKVDQDKTSNLVNTAGGAEREEEFPGMLWSFNWLPLGGFVKIKGENGENALEEDSFGHHKAWKRIVVLAAGVFMNFVLAVVVLGLGFMIGLPADVDGFQDSRATIVGEPGVVVQQVEADTPAEVAGIIFGDKILTINGIQISGTEQMQEVINSVGQIATNVEVLRGDEKLDIQVTPEILGDEESARLGVAIANVAVVKYPWYLALYMGLKAATVGLINIFVAFFLLIQNLIMGHGLLFDVAGPVGIASMVGQSAKLGFNYLLNITAMLSLSLAAINILPIPALDGGRILFVLIEKIIRRPVPMKYEQLAHTIGFVLLMALIVVVTFRDVVKLF